MPLLFHNRLLQIWKIDLKQVDSSIWSSAILVAMIEIIGAINMYAATMVSVLSVIGISVYYYHVCRHHIKTRFFTFWSICWILCMIVVIEFILPLLEILPEEHFLLVLLSCMGGYFAVKANRRSPSTNNHQIVTPKKEGKTVDDGNIRYNKDIESGVQTALLSPAVIEKNIKEQNVCYLCHKEVINGSLHCQVCGFCVQDHYHHSYVLNCCISPLNYCQYILSLIFSLLALILAANFMLTTICHPFLLARIATIAILIPDDCSNVFEAYSDGLALMAAIFAVLWSGCIVVTLCVQFRKFIYKINRQRKSLEMFGGDFLTFAGDANRKSEMGYSRKSFVNCMNLWRKVTS